jgi:hypothetical protein
VGSGAESGNGGWVLFTVTFTLGVKDVNTVRFQGGMNAKGDA